MIKLKTFNLKEHWDLFLDDKLVVNCETEELAIEFLTYCYDQGMEWNSGDSLKKTNWDRYENITCYNCEGYRDMLYGDIDYFQKNSYEVVKFKGFEYKPEPNFKIGTRKIFYLNV